MENNVLHIAALINPMGLKVFGSSEKSIEQKIVQHRLCCESRPAEFCHCWGPHTVANGQLVCAIRYMDELVSSPIIVHKIRACVPCRLYIHAPSARMANGAADDALIMLVFYHDAVATVNRAGNISLYIEIRRKYALRVRPAAQYETIDRGAVAAYLLCQAHQHALAAQRRRDPIYSNECYS